jgi:hypothetical protein
MANRIFPKQLFDAMYYKVHSVKSLDNVDKLAALSGFFDVEVPYPTETRKYLCYVFDKRSPFVKEISTIKDRKEQAASQAGFNLADNSHKEWLNTLYAVDDERVLELILLLLKGQADRLWQVICAKENYFEECVRGLFTPIDADRTNNAKQHIEAIQVKSKLREEIDLLQNSLQNDYRNFFGDEEEELRRLLNEQRRIDAESVAKKRKG